MTHLSELYDQDFHAWALQQASLIRAGRMEQLSGLALGPPLGEHFLIKSGLSRKAGAINPSF